MSDIRHHIGINAPRPEGGAANPFPGDLHISSWG